MLRNGEGLRGHFPAYRDRREAVFGGIGRGQPRRLGSSDPGAPPPKIRVGSNTAFSLVIFEVLVKGFRGDMRRRRFGRPVEGEAVSAEDNPVATSLNRSLMTAWPDADRDEVFQQYADPQGFG